jgi:thymidylate synthase
MASLGTPVNLGIFSRFSDAWLACLSQVVDEGHRTTDDGTQLREVLNLTLSSWDCEREDLIAAGADPARVELMVEKYMSLGVLPMYDMSYGKLFRYHHGVDQIEWIVRRLRARPEAKSATIGFHTPGDDVLSCISLLDCKLRLSQLHLTAVFRSQNVFGSQPGNALALREIQKEIAVKLGVSMGVLTLHVLSAHIYERDWDVASQLACTRSRTVASGSGVGCGGCHE